MNINFTDAARLGIAKTLSTIISLRKTATIPRGIPI
jgi:hypothetical protein